MKYHALFSLKMEKSWEIFLHAQIGEWDLKVSRQACQHA